jgi:hypothetical protein
MSCLKAPCQLLDLVPTINAQLNLTTCYIHQQVTSTERSKYVVIFTPGSTVNIWSPNTFSRADTNIARYSRRIFQTLISLPPVIATLILNLYATEFCICGCIFFSTLLLKTTDSAVMIYKYIYHFGHPMLGSMDGTYNMESFGVCPNQQHYGSILHFSFHNLCIAVMVMQLGF